jgi:diacylglycerol kinase family enzyme
MTVRHRRVGRPPLPQRAAAAVALLTLAGALAAAVIAVLPVLVVLPVAAAGVVGTVLAGWTALVCRGRRRAAGLLLALLACAGTVALLGVQTVAGAVLVLLLVAVSNAAARVALAPAALAHLGRRVGPARRGALFMNARSGGGKVARFRLAEEARRRGITPIMLQPGNDLRVLAERAVADGADVIGVAGGDGSLALVADVARRHDVAFVCVPAGTRNHFALDLGLDRRDVASALDAFGEAIERRVDLATVADRVFVNNASLGVYATIVQSEAYRGAKLATAGSMLPDLLGPSAAPFDLRYVGPDGTPAGGAEVLLVSNNPYRLRALAGIGSRPHLDTGVLGIVAVRAEKAADILSLLASEAAGTTVRPELRQWTTPTFRVDSDAPVPAGVDGEALLLQPPLQFRAMPAALRVRLPLTAPGARQGTLGQPGVRQTVTALFDVLAGIRPVGVKYTPGPIRGANSGVLR